MFLLLLRQYIYLGGLGKKPHQKICLGGSIKWYFKCSKINKLGNLAFPFWGFWPRPPLAVILLDELSRWLEDKWEI